MRLKNLEAVLILCMALILWLFSGCVPAPTESPASCAPLAKMSAEATLPEGHYLSDPLTVPLETTGQMRMVVKDSTIFLETVTLRGTPARPVTGMTDPEVYDIAGVYLLAGSFRADLLMHDSTLVKIRWMSRDFNIRWKRPLDTPTSIVPRKNPRAQEGCPES